MPAANAFRTQLVVPSPDAAWPLPPLKGTWTLHPPLPASPEPGVPQESRKQYCVSVHDINACTYVHNLLSSRGQCYPYTAP